MLRLRSITQLLASVTIALTCGASVRHLHGQSIFWRQLPDGQVGTAGLQGEDARIIATETGGLPGFGIGVDSTQGKVYWPNIGNLTTSNLDGSGLSPWLSLKAPREGDGVLINVAIWALDIDPVGQRMFLVGANVSRAFVVDMVSSTVIGSFPVPSVPHGVAYNPDNGRLYIPSQNGRLYSTNVDGSDLFDLWPSVSGSLSGVAIDRVGGKLYVGGTTADVIYRSDLDGSNWEVFHGTGNNIFDVSVDQANGYLYWTQENPGQVYRSRLTRAEPEAIVTRPRPASVIGVDVVNMPTPTFTAAAGGNDFLDSSAVTLSELSAASLDEAYPFDGTVFAPSTTESRITWSHATVISDTQASRAVFEVGLVGVGANTSQLTSFLMDGLNLTDLLTAALTLDPLGPSQAKTYRIDLPLEALPLLADGQVTWELVLQQALAADLGPDGTSSGLALDFARITVLGVPEPSGLWAMVALVVLVAGAVRKRTLGNVR